MKALFALAALVSVVLAGACLPKTNQADGSSCGDDEECKSGRCFDGFCAGSSCKPSDASSCQEGWKCTHNEADPITGFFGNDGSDTCKPTCGHCPGNAHCPKDAPAGAFCVFGKAPLEMSVVVDDAIVGRPVKLLATTKSGAILVECTWSVGDGKGTETTQGPLLTRTFDEARQYRVDVSCKDDRGAIGSVDSNFTVACTPSGEQCVVGTCCADPNMRCVGGTCRLPSPPVFDIEGPTSIAIDAPATYRAKLVSGEGQLESATWHFADDAPFTKQGLQVDHAFDTAGEISVTLKAGTSLRTQGEKVIVVNVCQKDGGRCDQGNVTCCAPLTCQGTTIKTCKP